MVVNRFWKQFFGTGLCASVEDLGLQGEWPSHPELLDWLAVEFRQPADPKATPWDVKRIVRLIVTSTTYRQQSNLPPALRESDPGNRLLAAQSPRRLEAEFVRDNALAAAGLLNLADVGGPSVKPYQPEGYYAPIQFPDREYVAETDERQYRRGVYMHWQRTFLHPMLANFDAPSREDAICVADAEQHAAAGADAAERPEVRRGQPGAGRAGARRRRHATSRSSEAAVPAGAVPLAEAERASVAAGVPGRAAQGVQGSRRTRRQKLVAVGNCAASRSRTRRNWPRGRTPAASC